MKNLFKPFNAESLLVTLGLTFITYMITPIVKEVFRYASSDNKTIYNIGEEKEDKFVMDKGAL